jgi:hypothetical protein
VTPAAPDYADPFVGWRVWVVVREQDELRLASVLYPTAWPVREEVVAACRPRAGEPEAAHAVPDARCSCGIYAASSVEDAATYFDGRGADTPGELYRVIGQVSLWGSVLEGGRGWRASHAYPSRLYVPARCLSGPSRLSAGTVALALTDYGVPVELLDGMTKRRVCAELASELPRAA